MSTSNGYLWGNFALGCIGFMASSFVIFTYLMWKQGRKSPGDIIFALAMSSLLLSIYWIIYPLWFLSSDEAINPTSGFCQTCGFIAALGFSGQFVYNFAYCLTLRQAITNVLKVNTRFKLLTHAVCVTFTIGMPIYLLSDGQIGQDSYGMCAVLLEKQSIFIEIILQFIYVISALYTIWYFYQNIPDDESLKHYKSKLLIRYVVYIASTAVMLVFMAISNIAAALIKQSQVQNSSDGVIYALIANIASTAGPLILCFVRLKNPAINRKLRRLVSMAFLTDEKLEIEMPQKTERGESTNADPQFSELQKNIRMFQIRTILNGVIHYYQHQHEEYSDEMLPSVQRKSSVDDSTSSMKSVLLNLQSPEDEDIANTLQYYQLNNKALNQEFSYHIHTKPGEEINDKIIKKNMSLYPRMCALAPRFFSILMYLDKIEINAADSFCPVKNAANIESMVGPDGGKSGEFFFFTYDNKWILKTLSEKELMAYRQRFPEYMHHMVKNRNSLINKIYGIFSIDMNQMQTQFSQENSIYHMVLMRNLSQVPRRYIKRIFDLKGSEVAREVLKSKSDSIDLTKLTLKDKDFENTEHQIYITDEMTTAVKQALIADARFFQKAQLMDYSLLVMKVCWGEYFRDYPGTRLDEIKKGFTQLQLLPVQGDADMMCYHFSVIDYFQEWNLKKMTEKTTKQIMAMNANLDTSAQNPDFYADRFIANVIEKIFKLN